MPCSQHVFMALPVRSQEARRDRFLHQYCETMWFPWSCWIRKVFIGLAECRFLHVPTDLRQELTDVIATVGTKDIENTFDYHRRVLRTNLRGSLSRVALWQTGRKGVVTTPEDETLRAVPFPNNMFKSKLNSELSLGEEKMTEWTNDKDFITLHSTTTLSPYQKS